MTSLSLHLLVSAAELIAADLFALVIFWGDGFVKLNEAAESCAPGLARFLHIAKVLPIELQMVLCQRAAGGAADLIPSKTSERAFRTLTWKCHLCSQ